MNSSQYNKKKTFDLYHNKMRAIFVLQQSSLTIQLWVYEHNKIYDTTYTEQTYDKEIMLRHYFETYQQLYLFAHHLNDQFISADQHGRIWLTIFDQELQEKTIEIKLKQQNQIHMFQRIQSLQNAYLQLAKHFIQQRKNHEEEMCMLRKDFQRMMVSHDTSVINLQMKQRSQQQESIYRHMKHSRLNISDRSITNEHSNDYEIRWAIIGPQASKQRTTFLKLKVNKANWVALGFCHEDIIRSRNYTKMNGCGQHGAYIMDSYGWMYAHQDQKANYKREGFIINEKDVITIIYDPQSQVITFINHNTWQRYDLHLNIQGRDIHPCIACNMETDIEIINYSR